jgi:hypothetical protein
MIVMALLTNGEEVFGELLNENDRGIDLDNALLMTYTTINGEPNIIFRKYCTYSNNFDIFFKREHIVAVFKDLRDEILKSYEMTMEVYNENGLPGFEEGGDEYMAEFDMPEADDDVELDDSNFFIQNGSKKVH